MRIVRRYLFRLIIITTMIVLLILLGLGGFIEFIGQLDDVGIGDYGIPQALAYSVLKLPGLAFVMLPMATLLGALLALGSLANRSELIVLRAAGISVSSLARAVGYTGAVIAVVTLVLGEYIAPPLDQYARTLRTLSQHGQSGLAGGQNAWIREGDTIFNVNRMTPAGQSGGVYLFRLTPDGDLAGIGRADSAGVDEQNQWLLRNYTETKIMADGVEIVEEGRTTQPTTLHPDLIDLTVVRPSSLDGLMLYRYVRYLETNGLNAHRYAVAWWSRIASSAAVIPMCILALPFVFGRLRTTGGGARMVTGVVIGLAWFLASRSLADGSEVYDLGPALVAWLPTVVLTVCVGVALARVR